MDEQVLLKQQQESNINVERRRIILKWTVDCFNKNCRVCGGRSWRGCSIS